MGSIRSMRVAYRYRCPVHAMPALALAIGRRFGIETYNQIHSSILGRKSPVSNTHTNNSEVEASP